MGPRQLDKRREQQAARLAVSRLIEAARHKGIPNHLLGETMVIEGWMLLTDATEAEARKAITTVLTTQLELLNRRVS
jgi:hypothetical protein